MSTMTASSAPNSTSSQSRTIPRPPPSPLLLNSLAPSGPSPGSSLSPAPGTPRRASTPLSSDTAAPPTSSNGDRRASTPGGWNDQPAENLKANTKPASKGRARDMLRKHYGLGVGPPPPLTGPNKPLDPMNPDSPAFDAKSYYEQLITTSSLSGLLKRDNELLSEIRQLESERQSLVYNHHHELIAASDTISAMKNRAEGVDADLDKLRFAFSEISRLNEELIVEGSGNDNINR